MQPDDLAPLIASAFVFMIPIVAILTAHQRKMALIMRGIDEKGRSMTPQDSEQLRREVAELRQLVHQQAISIDTMASQQAELLASLKGSSELQERVRTDG